MAYPELSCQRMDHRGGLVVRAGLQAELRDAMQAGAERAAAENLPDQTLAVSAVAHSGGAQVFAGASAGGEYVLAIVAHPGASAPVPVHMAALSAEFGVQYVLDEGATQQALRVSVLQCRSLDAEVRTLFASFAFELLSALPRDPREADVADELGTWLGLFWRLQAPSRTDVVGLVGELILIRTAPRPEEWVRAWHSVPTSTLDFMLTDPSIEVEVKATQSATRSHTISADQAFSLGNRYFASLHVELRDTGTTIGDLAREIADGLGTAADREKFWRILAAECGASFGDFMTERFIAERSRESLEFFKRDDIPRPELGYPLPAGVSGLTFRSDFSSSPSQGRDDFFAELDG
jgi:hypothetical protein